VPTGRKGPGHGHPGGPKPAAIHTTRADRQYYQRGLLWDTNDFDFVAFVGNEWQSIYSLDGSSIAIAWTDEEGDACDLCPDLTSNAAAYYTGDAQGDMCDACPATVPCP
jgi:hypothetical protein